MNTRIRAVRKALKLSQNDFGERLGVSRSVIANLECSRVSPREPFISLLCKEYKVNRSWMDTGEGEMFQQERPRDRLSEAIEIFKGLRPELQDYALKQIRGLADLQGQKKN